MGWEIRTPSAWPWSVQEIEQSFTRAARDDHSATRGSQDRHQTKRSTVGPKRRKLSDQLSEKAERSAVGSHVVKLRTVRDDRAEGLQAGRFPSPGAVLGPLHASLA